MEAVKAFGQFSVAADGGDAMRCDTLRIPVLHVRSEYLCAKLKARAAFRKSDIGLFL